MASGDDETVTQTQSTDGLDLMVRKFVRLALACEYSRTPIRRSDVSAKVLEQTGARKFKVVFDKTQETLKEVFGMQMVELPAREKITLAQRRRVLAFGGQGLIADDLQRRNCRKRDPRHTQSHGY